MENAQQEWTQRLWHLSHQEFACAADAWAALERERKELPLWLEVQGQAVAQPRYATRGRPRKEAAPVASVWHLQAQLSVNQERVEQEVQRQACFIVGTNWLDPAQLSAEELAVTYKDQGSVERGFRFLKDPLFLAWSVFLKKPERIMALSLIIMSRFWRCWVPPIRRSITGTSLKRRSTDESCIRLAFVPTCLSSGLGRSRRSLV